MSDLLLTYYGDDFTGSTDVMEVLEWGGVPTVLFLDPADANTLQARFPEARAIGIAGVSRTMSPAQMDEHLPTAFEALRAFGAPYAHYKICSTFDSSPTVGSIGRATEIGQQIFGAKAVPMMVGAPKLRRYVAFSNLFARVDDVTYRLDRHPTMSKHPITPMDESDLRVHLGKQTDLSIGAMTVLHIERSDADVDDYFQGLMDGKYDIILFDSINDAHLHTIGRLLWAMRDKDAPIFLVGSSGFQYALTHYWNTEGIFQPKDTTNIVGAVDQLIVMSGSAAPATADQITWALANGFTGLRLDSENLVDPATADATREATIQEALTLIGEGKNLLMFSTHGSDDPAISATNDRLARIGKAGTNVGSILAPQQGMILRDLLTRTGLRRAVVCGGDTCGYATRQLGIFALQALIPVAPGAPLCRASSDDPYFDGLEISLKAGQVGKPDYFRSILRGSAT